jgi:hypothetical protein
MTYLPNGSLTMITQFYFEVKHAYETLSIKEQKTREK